MRIQPIDLLKSEFVTGEQAFVYRDLAQLRPTFCVQMSNQGDVQFYSETLTFNDLATALEYARLSITRPE
jgi:hypothetical protein